MQAETHPISTIYLIRKPPKILPWTFLSWVCMISEFYTFVRPIGIEWRRKLSFLYNKIWWSYLISIWEGAVLSYEFSSYFFLINAFSLANFYLLVALTLYISFKLEKSKAGTAQPLVKLVASLAIIVNNELAFNLWSWSILIYIYIDVLPTVFKYPLILKSFFISIFSKR